MVQWPFLTTRDESERDEGGRVCRERGPLNRVKSHYSGYHRIEFPFPDPCFIFCVPQTAHVSGMFHRRVRHVLQLGVLGQVWHAALDERDMLFFWSLLK